MSQFTAQTRSSGPKDPSKMDTSRILRDFSDLINTATAEPVDFKDLLEVTIGIEVTRQLATCVWECGGAMSSYGTSMIVAQADGNRPKSVFSRAGSTASSGGTHALIPIGEGNAILIGHQRSGHTHVLVYRVSSIRTTPVIVKDDDGVSYDTTSGTATLSLQMIVNKNKNELFKIASDFATDTMIEAINMAAKKATIISCRRAMYIQDWRNIREADRKFTIDGIEDDMCNVYFGKNAARAFMVIVDNTLSTMMTVDEREKPTVIYEQTIVPNHEAVAYYNLNKNNNNKANNRPSVVGGFNVIDVVGIGIVPQEDAIPDDVNADMIRVKCITITPRGESDESIIGFFDKTNYEAITSRWFQNSSFERMLELIKRSDDKAITTHVQYLGN